MHWAHRVADRFPDGQLYVNLRGFDPAGRATRRGAARIPGRPGRPADRIPADLDAQAGLYRSLLAGRRMLVVLDNAARRRPGPAAAARHAGCLVVVTSRNRLTGLVAADGARPMAVEVCPRRRPATCSPAGSATGRAAEPAPPTNHPRCAGLPLALAIAAARAVAHPTFPPPVAADLAQARSVWTRWPPTIPPAASGWCSPGPTALTPDAAYSGSWGYIRAPTSPPRPRPACRRLRPGRDLLSALVGVNLISEHLPGRYAFHDLLRAYAIEQSNARGRRHGTASGRAAHRRALPAQRPRGRRPALPARRPGTSTPSAGVTRNHSRTWTGALAWFTAEHHVLLSIIDLAAAAGTGTRGVAVAAAVTTYLDFQGHWADLAAVRPRRPDCRHQACQPDPRGLEPTVTLGLSASRLAHFTDADEHYHRALADFHALDDPIGQAHTHLDLGLAPAPTAPRPAGADPRRAGTHPVSGRRR